MSSAEGGEQTFGKASSCGQRDEDCHKRAEGKGQYYSYGLGSLMLCSMVVPYRSNSLPHCRSLGCLREGHKSLNR